LFVMLAEYLVNNKTNSFTVKFSVAVIIAGALIAGARDLEFDFLSYGVVLLYNCSTALYLVLIKYTSKRTGLGNFDLMYYNGIVAIPITFVVSILTGELEQAAHFESLWNIGFQISLIGSCGMAFLLNYAIFWNTSVNSPLTQNVAGQAKDVVAVLIGYLFFQRSKVIDPFNSLGVFVGFIGGSLYALAKWQQLNK